MSAENPKKTGPKAVQPQSKPAAKEPKIIVKVEQPSEKKALAAKPAAKETKIVVKVEEKKTLAQNGGANQQAAPAERKKRASRARAAEAEDGEDENPPEAKSGGRKKSQAQRRGPGRPPSKPPAPPLPFHGVVDNPSDPENIIEFVYGSPEVLKSMFTYFKNLKSRDVRICFSPTGVSFFSRDHTETCRVVATLPGASVNWYYCQKTHNTSINREKVEKMFASINKSFNKLTIVLRHDDTDAITFILKDPELDKDCRYMFPTSSPDADVELMYAEKEITPEMLEPGPECKFPIQFTLSSKAFKKSIVDASGYSDYLVVEKNGGDHPLQFVYDKVGTTYRETYKDDKKIKLVSSVEEGSTFRCALNLANIKSLASSMVTDSVAVYLRDDGDILLRSAVDEKALVISTLAKPGEEPR
jgi:intracellular sulfur oxidation DsrE/DsrF family protein